MPKVGGKHYDYSPKGIAMAKNSAKKKGVKVQYKSYGGTVKMEKGGGVKVMKCRGA
jgi:hypothetical protein